MGIGTSETVQNALRRDETIDARPRSTPYGLSPAAYKRNTRSNFKFFTSQLEIFK